MRAALPLVRLRELERGDLPLLNQWRNDEEVIELLGNNFMFISSAVDEAWYEGYLKARDKAVRLSILAGESGQYVGNVNLTSIHWVNRSAEFSIVIGDKRYWSRGIGRIATRLILKHGFLDLNLNRIHLGVVSGNQRAISLYRRVGFAEEGRQREALFKKGEHQDLVLMSMLRREFSDGGE